MTNKLVPCPTEQVREFHQAFGLTDRCISSYSFKTRGANFQEWLSLRKKLIKEEKRELFEALDGSDYEHIVKEACDLLYVVHGLLVSLHGVEADNCFAEVHASNMSKLGPEGKPIYREDGKVLKPDNYKPANLSPYLK